MTWAITVSTVVSAVAATVSVVAAFQTNGSERRLRESLEATSSVAEWAKSLNEAGGHCAAVLAQFSALEFEAFANRAIGSDQLKPDQRTFLSRCTVAYDKPPFDPENDLKITDYERSYITSRILGNLNSYEAMAMKWTILGPDSQQMICKQACIPATSPYVAYSKVAAGTKLWNYPNLKAFMDACKC